jgi:Nuclease-related domain
MTIDSMLRTIVTSVAAPLLIVVAFCLPMIVIGLLLFRKKRMYRAEANGPFTQLPLRPPGESLRLFIEELSEQLDSYVILLCLAGLGSATTVIASSAQNRLKLAIVMFVLTVAVASYCALKLFPLVRQIWDYRLGFMGERVVGEELNQLLAVGFRVFHDVPFEKSGMKFNIDHVLVGPPGVYAVETKARRKPTDIKGLPRATVYSDGDQLKFPRFVDTESITQARINARDLAAWLTKAIGERIDVNAILTLPGWAVERTKSGDVNVLRPDEIKRSFPSRPRQPLGEQQIKRIAYQLEERCRLENPS